jgi:hypothetical protein
MGPGARGEWEGCWGNLPPKKTAFPDAVAAARNPGADERKEICQDLKPDPHSDPNNGLFTAQHNGRKYTKDGSSFQTNGSEDDDSAN